MLGTARKSPSVRQRYNLLNRVTTWPDAAKHRGRGQGSAGRGVKGVSDPLGAQPESPNRNRYINSVWTSLTLKLCGAQVEAAVRKWKKLKSASG